MAKQQKEMSEEEVRLLASEPITAGLVTKRIPRSRRPGHHSVFIHITDEAWAKICAYIDDKCLDEGKFLTRKMSDLADSL